jgi:hypothetical protein
MGLGDVQADVEHGLLRSDPAAQHKAGQGSSDQQQTNKGKEKSDNQEETAKKEAHDCEHMYRASCQRAETEPVCALIAAVTLQHALATA